MKTSIETLGVAPWPPSHQANPLRLSVPLAAKAKLREKFETFSHSLDLAPIKYKLIKDKAWTLERADRVEPQYKAFLFLIGSRVKAEFVPTFDIDEMWHAHILDTRKYMTDCSRHFGEYIHHYPYLGMKDTADRSRAEGLFAVTCATIGTAFGIDVHDLDATSCGSGCGHGCGGHGCGGGHSSCGSGHSDGGGHSPDHGDHSPGGGGHQDSDDGSLAGIIAGCSRSDAGGRRKPTAPKAPSESEEKKPGIWRRIFGLSSSAVEMGWYASVTPKLFEEEFRPDGSALTRLGGATVN